MTTTRFVTDKLASDDYGSSASVENQTLANISAPNGTETLLVVDDEKAMLRAVSLMLRSLGYKVLDAHGPEQALAMSRSYTDKIHLLLTDVVMPKYSGLELKKKILAERPDTKYLYMSGHTANIIARHGILEEDIQLLQKPFTRRELALKLREVLAG